MENSNILKDAKDHNKTSGICLICNNKLTFIMPTSSLLYCEFCDKYFENTDGIPGKEIRKPLHKKDVFY